MTARDPGPTPREALAIVLESTRERADYLEHYRMAPAAVVARLREAAALLASEGAAPVPGLRARIEDAIMRAYAEGHSLGRSKDFYPASREDLEAARVYMDFLPDYSREALALLSTPDAVGEIDHLGRANIAALLKVAATHAGDATAVRGVLNPLIRGLEAPVGDSLPVRATGEGRLSDEAEALKGQWQGAGFLHQWLGLLEQKYLLSEEDRRTLVRVRLALYKANEHHEQARASAPPPQVEESGALEAEYRRLRPELLRLVGWESIGGERRQDVSTFVEALDAFVLAALRAAPVSSQMLAQKWERNARFADGEGWTREAATYRYCANDLRAAVPEQREPDVDELLTTIWRLVEAIEDADMDKLSTPLAHMIHAIRQRYGVPVYIGTPTSAEANARQD